MEIGSITKISLVLLKYDFFPKKIKKIKNVVYDEYNLKGYYRIGVVNQNNSSENKDRGFFGDLFLINLLIEISQNKYNRVEKGLNEELLIEKKSKFILSR